MISKISAFALLFAFAVEFGEDWLADRRSRSGPVEREGEGPETAW